MKGNISFVCQKRAARTAFLQFLLLSKGTLKISQIITTTKVLRGVNIPARTCTSSATWVTLSLLFQCEARPKVPHLVSMMLQQILNFTERKKTDKRARMQRGKLHDIWAEFSELVCVCVCLHSNDVRVWRERDSSYIQLKKVNCVLRLICC